MVHIIRRPSWWIAESLATPQSVYLNRRHLLRNMGIAGLGLAATAVLPPVARAAAEGPGADLYPAERNEAFVLDRELTPKDVSSRYNNFYEFGSHKQIWRAAQALQTQPWDITIDGLVDKPFTIGFEDLLHRVTLQERLYRLRCVEAWSMAVPWTGFPLSDLIALANPLSSARYIRFETFLDPEIATGQRQRWYPWPYVEGVTMEEGANDLAFMVTGAYGGPIEKQFGAPLRLALPWKYGFKSIKSIKRISFTDERPVSFWETILPQEYGFWANVNPEVPHRRWSQKQERVLHTGETVPTLLFNGYADQVAYLYDDLPDESLFM